MRAILKVFVERARGDFSRIVGLLALCALVAGVGCTADATGTNNSSLDGSLAVCNSNFECREAGPCESPFCNSDGTCEYTPISPGISCVDGEVGKCDANGECRSEDAGGLADGETCTKNINCDSGYCNAGVCCSGDDCCQDDADCEGNPDYDSTSCNDQTCEGTRRVPRCVNHQCDYDLMVDAEACEDVVLDCNGFPDVACSGVTATPASCADDCQNDDNNCDTQSGFVCNGTACVAPSEAGSNCGPGDTCDGGLTCDTDPGICCSTGDCCNDDGDCAGNCNVTTHNCESQNPLGATCGANKDNEEVHEADLDCDSEYCAPDIDFVNGNGGGKCAVKSEEKCIDIKASGTVEYSQDETTCRANNVYTCGKINGKVAWVIEDCVAVGKTCTPGSGGQPAMCESSGGGSTDGQLLGDCNDSGAACNNNDLSCHPDTDVCLLVNKESCDPNASESECLGHCNDNSLECESCVNNFDCGGTRNKCIQSQCRTAQDLGGVCDNHGDCLSGACDGSPGVCVDPGCLSNAECGSGNYCIPESQGNPFALELCSDVNFPCACQQTQSTIGQWCDENSDCSGNDICENNKCEND